MGCGYNFTKESLSPVFPFDFHSPLYLGFREFMRAVPPLVASLSLSLSLSLSESNPSIVDPRTDGSDKEA